MSPRDDRTILSASSNTSSDNNAIGNFGSMTENKINKFANFDDAATAFDSFIQRGKAKFNDDMFETGTKGSTDNDSSSRKSTAVRTNSTRAGFTERETDDIMPEWGSQSMSAFDEALAATNSTPEFDPFSLSSSNLEAPAPTQPPTLATSSLSMPETFLPNKATKPTLFSASDRESTFNDMFEAETFTPTRAAHKKADRWGLEVTQKDEIESMFGEAFKDGSHSEELGLSDMLNSKKDDDKLDLADDINSRDGETTYSSMSFKTDSRKSVKSENDNDRSKNDEDHSGDSSSSETSGSSKDSAERRKEALRAKHFKSNFPKSPAKTKSARGESEFDPFSVVNTKNASTTTPNSFHQSLGPSGFSMDFMVGDKSPATQKDGQKDGDTKFRGGTSGLAPGRNKKWVVDSSGHSRGPSRGRSIGPESRRVTRNLSGSIHERMGPSRSGSRDLLDMSAAVSRPRQRSTSRIRTQPRPTIDDGTAEEIFKVVESNVSTSVHDRSVSSGGNERDSSHDGRSVSEMRPRAEDEKELSLSIQQKDRSVSVMRERDRAKNHGGRRQRSPRRKLNDDVNGEEERHSSTRHNRSSDDRSTASRLRRAEGAVEEDHGGRSSRRNRSHDKHRDTREIRSNEDISFREGDSDRDRSRFRRTKSNDDVVGDRDGGRHQDRPRRSKSGEVTYASEEIRKARRGGEAREHSPRRSQRPARSTDKEIGNGEDERDRSKTSRRRTKSFTDKRDLEAAVGASNEDVLFDHDEARRLITELKEKKARDGSSEQSGKDRRKRDVSTSGKKDDLASNDNDAASLLAKLKERKARRERGEAVDEEDGSGASRIRARPEASQTRDESRRDRRTSRADKPRQEADTPGRAASDQSTFVSPKGSRYRSNKKEIFDPSSPEPSKEAEGNTASPSPFFDKLSKVMQRRIPRRYKGIIAQSEVSHLSAAELDSINLESIIKEATINIDDGGDDGSERGRQFIEQVIQKVLDANKSLHEQGGGATGDIVVDRSVRQGKRSSSRPQKNRKSTTDEAVDDEGRSSRAKNGTSRGRDTSKMKTRSRNEENESSTRSQGGDNVKYRSISPLKISKIRDPGNKSDSFRKKKLSS